ncbi:MAG: hypothetical protein WDZ93_01525 [Candidatus Paceibacterota bacterium]
MRNIRYTLFAVLMVGIAVTLFVLATRVYEPHLDNSDGSVPVRLHAVWRTTLYDPILALPETNVTELERSLEALAESRDVYTGRYAEHEQEIIDAALYPMAFLTSLPELEDARRVFIAKPSYWRAIRYHVLLARSLAFLRSDARILSDAMYTEAPDIELSTPAGATSLEYIAGTLADIYVRADDLLAQSMQRLRCLLPAAERGACDAAIPLYTNQNSVRATRPAEDLSQRTEALRAVMVDAGPFAPVAYLDRDPHTLPLVYIPEAECTVDQSATYLYFWRSSRYSGRPVFWLTPVSEILFHDTAQQTSPFETALARTGATYVYQQMNPYLCIDYGLDSGTVRTVQWMFETLHSEPLLTSYDVVELPEPLAQARTYEQKIRLEDSVLNAADYDAYIGHVTAFLNTTDDPAGVLDEATVYRLIDMVTLWRAQSAWFETEISRIDDMAATSRYVFEVMEIPIESLLFTRSYYTSLFLAANATLYTEPVRFLRERAGELDPASGLVLYRGALQATVPIETLASFILEQKSLSADVYTVE